MGNLEPDKSQEKQKISDKINEMFRNYNKLTEHYKQAKSREKNVTILLNMMNTLLSNSLPASALHDPTYKNMQSMLENLNSSFAAGFEPGSIDFETSEMGATPETENIYKIVKSHSRQLRVLEGANAYLSELLQLKEGEIRELKSAVENWKTGEFTTTSSEKIVSPQRHESISTDPKEHDNTKEISDLKSQVFKLQSENHDLQAALNIWKSDNAKLKADYSILEQERMEIKHASPTISEIDNSKLDDANAKIKNLETEILRYKTRIAELEKADVKLKEQESEITRLKLQLREEDKKVSALKEEVNKLLKEKEELSTKNSNSGKELKEAYDRLVTDFDKLKALNIEIEPGIFL